MVRRNNPKAGITKAVNIMAKIVTVLEGVLIAGSHFEKGEVVNCDDGDADQLFSIKRARALDAGRIQRSASTKRKRTTSRRSHRPRSAPNPKRRPKVTAKEGEEGNDKEVDKSGVRRR
jgi:hypothetical protein